MECNNQDVSFYMVENGYARFNHQNSSDNELELAKMEARDNKRGLWNAQLQKSPWVWHKIIRIKCVNIKSNKSTDYVY